MKWRGQRGSRNVIDSRRRKGAAMGGGLSMGAVAILVIGWLLGVDLSPMLGLTSGAPTSGGQITQADEERAQFASVVLRQTEDIWAQVLPDQAGIAYQPVQLELFSGQISSACGMASAATGPFYCPANERAYLDTDFFVTLDRQMGAGGDFAAAYVIAHEVAHHIQQELGILGQANRMRAQVGQTQSNQISVRIELQADCYSGIWARYAQDRLGTLERGDMEEALNAAARIGDDHLQRQASGRVRPDSFTHGTSAQRQRWFWTGYQTGKMAECDTFSARDL